MIDKTHFSNLTSKNILREPNNKDLSANLSSVYLETSLDNMVLNSNLDNENIIK